MPFTPPTLSALTAGLLIILQMLLMQVVVLLRRRHRQSLGDGGQPRLLAAIRTHGNLAENAGLFVAGFALLEILGGDRGRIAILCAVFVLARLSHVVGLSMRQTVNVFRVGGTAVTAIVGVALALSLIRVSLAHFAV